MGHMDEKRHFSHEIEVRWYPLAGIEIGVVRRLSVVGGKDRKEDASTANLPHFLQFGPASKTCVPAYPHGWTLRG